jgi:hypothetical protein
MTILVLEDIFEKEISKTKGTLEEGLLDLAGNFLGQIAKNNIKKLLNTGKVKASMPAIEMFYKLKKLGVKNIGRFKINQVIHQMEKQLGLRKNFAGKYHFVDDDDDDNNRYNNPFYSALQKNAPQVKGGFFDPTGAFRLPIVTKSGKTIFKTLDPRALKNKGKIDQTSLAKMLGIKESKLSLKEMFLLE